jgi:L-cysteine desulfidase
MNEKYYLSLLENELKIALGCTEPIAIAFAASLARNQIKGYSIDKIEIKASGNIIKNAMAVTIPGTNEYGAKIAAALGAIAGDSEKKLEVLHRVTKADVEKAKQLCLDHVFLTKAENTPELYIEVAVYGKGHIGRAILQNLHDCIVFLEKDGEMVIDKRDQIISEKIEFLTEDVEDILRFVNTVELKKLDIIKKSIEINSRISEEGLRANYGLSIGRTLMEDSSSSGLITYAVALTSAGSDARMAGVSLPAMSNSGSGNQGICAIMPVVAVAEKLRVSEERLLRAGTLSNLITIHAKRKFGRLSPLCGVVAAGIGASAGIVYIMGGQLKQVIAAIQNTIGNITGMICDGAKAGCAMKVATSVFAAVQSAFSAMRGKVVKPIEGIIENDVEDTIENISKISSEGMPSMDSVLLNIMVNKK